MAKIGLFRNLLIATSVAFVSAFGAFAADVATVETEAGAVADSAALVAARDRISEAINDPDVMKEIMSSLSAEEQVKFLGEVNLAIRRMPGSVETRAAAILNSNSAALQAAKPGNLTKLLAQSFATAQVEALPILAEQFAKDLFSREAAEATKGKISTESYIETVGKTMEVVNQTMAEVDGGNVRSAFVAVMFIRASGEINNEMVAAIGAFVPERSRQDAIKEWLPEALGLNGAEQSYDAMFAVINGDVIPEIVRTLDIAGPQFQGVLLSDLTGFNTDPLSKQAEHAPITDAIFNPFRLGRPISGNAKGGGGTIPGPTPEHDDPVKPYPGQKKS